MLPQPRLRLEAENSISKCISEMWISDSDLEVIIIKYIFSQNQSARFGFGIKR